MSGQGTAQAGHRRAQFDRSRIPFARTARQLLFHHYGAFRHDSPPAHALARIS
ncbi:hypothetical protein GCM10010357_08000 [Streptomyces luteireticuli]|uniref:Uncharacterized protein n=1 Tax=Streptomyces luteireticuli TaxID=173858 RepID=A0ABN0YB49_9ACTN